MSESLTVVNVAYPFAGVGPDAVGGAEQVLSLIDEALSEAGHRSIVVACRGSFCSGTLVCPPVPCDGTDTACRNLVYDALALTVDQLICDVRPHLVHLHGLDFHHYLPRPGPPVLVTLHLPLSLYPPHALAPRRPRTWLHGVSPSQMRDAHADMPRLPDVLNGVRLDRLSPTGRPARPYALVMGRICPEKGFHLAIEAAEQARVPLLVAGRVFPYASHRAYFDSVIAPRLGRRCRFVGAVGLLRKRVLLASARCLIVSSLIPETSSLVTMEALACGTPVVALRGGALSDIIEHGVTGFVVDSVAEMSIAVRDALALDRRACRAAAESRFDGRVTARTYIERYRALASAGPATVPCSA